MTFVSQDGWTSLYKPTATNVYKDKGRYCIQMLDQSGVWIPMGKYETKERTGEVLDSVRYHIRDIPEDLKEFQFPEK